jgi:hypothetical protein
VSDAAIEAWGTRQGKAANDPPRAHGLGPRSLPLASATLIWEDGNERRQNWRTAMVASRMYDWLIVILVSLAGYVEAPAWFILLGAFGLTIEGWWGKLGLLRHSPRALSTKKTAYFVAGAIGNLGLAALGYLLGQILRGLAP